jgi:hypothetical protein
MKKFTHLLAETDRLYDDPDKTKYWAAVEAAQKELERIVEGIAVRFEDGELTLEYEGRQIIKKIPVGADIKVEPADDICSCFFGIFLLNGEEIVREIGLPWLLGVGNGGAEIMCERLTVPEALVRRVQEAVLAAAQA